MKNGRAARVFYIDTVVGLAGGQFALVEILRSIDRSKIIPVVSSPPESGLRRICEESDIQWLSLPFSSAGISSTPGRRIAGLLVDLAKSAYGVIYLAVLSRRLAVDILHANTFKAGLLAGMAAALCGRPLVFHDRTLFGHLPLGWLIALLSRRVIVISRAVGAKYGSLFSAKLRLIPTSIDLEHYTPHQAGGTESKVVAYVGRISREKGIIHLVRCARRVLESLPEAEFVIAGSPFTDRGLRHLDELKQEIAGLGLSGKFRFLGYVDDVRSFLSGIGVLVLPSEKEGMGRVLLEAMALCKPVIAFDAGGPRELIESGKNGMLVRLGDEKALGDAVVEVLTNSDLARSIGERARRTVAASYDSRVVTRDLMRVYAEIRPFVGAAGAGQA
jgi:glycosyltransferase involved in cell wall biosynthesis